MCRATTTTVAAAALAALALLTGCAPENGHVTDRKVEVSCIKLNCDPVWKLQVTSDDPRDRHPVYTDRRNSGWATVTEAEYDRCQIGAAWPDCKAGER